MELSGLLENLRLRINDEKAKSNNRLSEQDTKSIFIDPILKALNWDLHDGKDIRREYRLDSSDNPIDYVLILKEKPVFLIEAKALHIGLDDRKWVNQMLGYAVSAGIRWCVLTNGDHYHLYNALAPVPQEKKLFASIVLSDVNRRQASLQVLGLISKSAISEGYLETIWNDHIDRKAEVAVRSEGGVGGACGGSGGNCARGAKGERKAVPEYEIEEQVRKYLEITSKIAELDQQKDELSQLILSLLPSDKKSLQTLHFKVTKVSKVNVKTTIESARALNCVCMEEVVDKDKLRRLHEEGVPVPDINTSEFLRISKREREG